MPDLTVADLMNAPREVIRQNAMLLGFIPLDLSAARIIAGNDVQNVATGAGGHLAFNTDPTFKRKNVATDKQIGVVWAANSVVEIEIANIPIPPDLDATVPIVVNFMGSKDTNVNTLMAVAVSFWKNTGSANGGTTTSAIGTTAVAKYTASVAVPAAYPGTMAVGFIPGAHANDALAIDSAWIEYSKKVS